MVARVGRPYSFQFSASTFAPEGTNFTYSISNGPAWLSLDAATRTLSGTPGSGYIGPTAFIITAADAGGGVAHMSCTLVVSTNPPPQLQGNIDKDLAKTANLSSAQPPTVTILPSTSFRFQFQQHSFIDIVRRKLYYYATLADHTPLPAWLQFDPQTLTFSGSAPQLSALPQSWGVELIASDVAGFAGTTVSFDVAIGREQLVFVPEQVHINISARAKVDLAGLRTTLFRNGKHLSLDALRSAKAAIPSWLSFNPETLALSGTAPSDATDQNCTITVEDMLGDQATLVLLLVVDQPAIFAFNVGTLKAHAGQLFTYRIPNSLFSTKHIDVALRFPATATWLHFDPTTRTLSGRAPSVTTPSSIKATMVAKSPTEPKAQTQTFTIDIATSATTVGTSPTNKSHASTGPASNGNEARTHLNSGIVAAVVLGILLAAGLLAALLYFLRKRRESMESREPESGTKQTISRPMLPADLDPIIVTTEVQRDVEMMADSERDVTGTTASAQAPRLGLDLATNLQSKRMKWSKRFSRISRASSLGNGENAIRGDSNIPVVGAESTAFYSPHHSFAASAEMTRLSGRPLQDHSPTKRALRRVRAKLRPPHTSTQSVGLGIDTGNAAVSLRPHSEGGRLEQRPGAGMPTSAAINRSSLTSSSTRGTSVLSARPSDFPRPPSRSAFAHRGSRPGVPYGESSNRKSIRVVERSDSTADERSMEEKRRSFIRNRASTGIASPLFAHGSRQLSSVRHSVRGSRQASNLLGSLTAYSKSPPVEPPTDQLGVRRRTKGRFAVAPLFPRATTASTMGADNSDSYYTTDEEISEPEYLTEMNLPRHQRSWVVPGEASPTPPPAPPSSRQASKMRQSTPPSRNAAQPRQKGERRVREESASSRTTAVAAPMAGTSASFASSQAGKVRRNRLSEPLSLVSNDSLRRAKQELPRLVPLTTGRPVSVERVRRMSSLQVQAEDARPGSEMFEALEGAGFLPGGGTESKATSQRSNISGPAFL